MREYRGERNTRPYSAVKYVVAYESFFNQRRRSTMAVDVKAVKDSIKLVKAELKVLRAAAKQAASTVAKLEKQLPAK